MTLEYAACTRAVSPVKEKIRELDILRGIALLAVILQHVLGVYSRRVDITSAESIMLGMLFNFSKFAIPAFVLITGIVLFYNHLEKLNYQHFMKKRAMEILVPYLVWTVVYQIYNNGIPSAGFEWIKELIKLMVLGNGSYHLWFVVMIFQFYLLTPVFFAIFKGLGKIVVGRVHFIVIMTLLAVSYALLMWFSSSYIPEGKFNTGIEVVQKLVDYRDRNFLFYSFYFILGAIAGTALVRWRDFVIRSVGWNSILFVFLFLWVGWQLLSSLAGGKINLNYSTSLKPSMFLYTVSQLLLVYGLSMAVMKYNSFLYGKLELLGRLSYGSYLVHALVLVYAVRIVDYIVPQGHYLLAVALALVICTLVSAGFTMLVSRIPNGKLLTGPYRG